MTQITFDRNNAKFNPLYSGPCIDGTGFTSATETDYDDAPFLFHYVQVLGMSNIAG
jgi:hypothetical protein